MRFLASCVTALTLLFMALQTTALSANDLNGYPTYDTYEDMKETLLSKLKNRKIRDALVASVGLGHFTEPQMKGIENQMLAAVPNRLKHHSTITYIELDNGWSEEVIALWVGTSYLFVNIKAHTREEGVIAASLDFNTSLKAVLPGFQ